MKLAWLLALMVVFGWSQLLSQDYRKNSIGLNLGLSFLANQDLLASPFRYNGTAPTFGITYWHLGNKNQQRGMIGFSDINIHSKNKGIIGTDSHTAESGTFQLAYYYRYRVNLSPSDKTAFYLGSGLHSSITLRVYDYGRGVPDETIGEAVSSLMLSAALTHRLREHWLLEYASSVSLVNFSFRNPYSLSTDQIADAATRKSIVGAYFELAKFTSLNDLALWMNELSASVLTMKRISLEGGYHFDVHYFKHPRKSVSLINTVSVSILYQF